MASSPPTAALSDLRASSGAVRERAWRELYRTHFARVYRLAFRCGVAPADVEDVTQQVFVVAHRNIDRLESTDSAGPWLYGITLRVASDYRRWARVRRLKAWLVRATGEAAAATVATPEMHAEAAQAQRVVARVLDRMSAKLREAFVLFEIEECSVEEAAEVLDIPVNTARSRRRLAREAFDKLLKRKGVEAP